MRPAENTKNTPKDYSKPAAELRYSDANIQELGTEVTKLETDLKTLQSADSQDKVTQANTLKEKAEIIDSHIAMALKNTENEARKKKINELRKNFDLVFNQIKTFVISITPVNNAAQNSSNNGLQQSPLLSPNADSMSPGNSKAPTQSFEAEPFNNAASNINPSDTVNANNNAAAQTNTPPANLMKKEQDNAGNHNNDDDSANSSIQSSGENSKTTAVSLNTSINPESGNNVINATNSPKNTNNNPAPVAQAKASIPRQNQNQATHSNVYTPSANAVEEKQKNNGVETQNTNNNNNDDDDSLLQNNRVNRPKIYSVSNFPLFKRLNNEDVPTNHLSVLFNDPTTLTIEKKAIVKFAKTHDILMSVVNPSISVQKLTEIVDSYGRQRIFGTTGPELEALRKLTADKESTAMISFSEIEKATDSVQEIKGARGNRKLLLSNPNAMLHDTTGVSNVYRLLGNEFIDDVNRKTKLEKKQLLLKNAANENEVPFSNHNDSKNEIENEVEFSDNNDQEKGIEIDNSDEIFSDVAIPVFKRTENNLKQVPVKHLSELFNALNISKDEKNDIIGFANKHDIPLMRIVNPTVTVQKLLELVKSYGRQRVLFGTTGPELDALRRLTTGKTITDMISFTEIETATKSVQEEKGACVNRQKLLLNPSIMEHDKTGVSQVYRLLGTELIADMNGKVAALKHETPRNDA